MIKFLSPARLKCYKCQNKIQSSAKKFLALTSPWFAKNTSDILTASCGASCCDLIPTWDNIKCSLWTFHICLQIFPATTVYIATLSKSYSCLGTKYLKAKIVVFLLLGYLPTWYMYMKIRKYLNIFNLCRYK